MRKIMLLVAFVFILSIGLVSAVAENTGFTAQGTDAGQSGYRGMSYFTGGKSATINSATKVGTTTCDTFSVMDSTNTFFLVNATFSGDTATLSYTLSPNTLYYIVARPSSGTCDVSWRNSFVYNVSGTYGNFTTGINTGTLQGATGWVFTSIDVTEASAPRSILTNPANNTGFASVAGQTFNATYSNSASTVTAVNSTLYVYTAAGALVGTNFTTYVPSNKSNFTIPNLADGNYLWNVLFGDSGGVSTFNNSNFTWAIDTAAPTGGMVTPANNSYHYSQNATYTQININISNIDANPGFCYYNSTFSSTITLVGCNVITQVNLTNVFGLHTIYNFRNDTAGNTFMNSSRIWIHKNIFENNTYETDNTLVLLELWNLSTAPTTAVLNYSGTNYSGTITSLGNGKYNLSRLLNIPTGTGTRKFSWWFTEGTQKQSNTISVENNGAFFTLCNATITTQYLNISFKNETVSQENVKASLASSTFTYYIGSASVNKTYTTSSVVEAGNYSFCFTPQNKTVTVLENVNYYNSISPQRSAQSTLTLTNTTTNQTLYLLPTSIGIYVTFQVVNNADQPLEGVNINVTSSTFGTVETRTTDASGTATFFLNPLIAYTVAASKSGYTATSQTITPTQSEYTLTLGGGSSSNPVSDNFRQVTYSIGPNGNYLTNKTAYNFNFTINSSYWSLTEWGFTIKNVSGSVFGTNSSTNSVGGTVWLNLNTGSNQSFIVNAYWNIQGNITNVTKTYYIFDNTGTDTSLVNLKNRIALYINNGGFFGLTSFGVNIIVFLIIMCTTGIVSYKFGITSPAVVFGIMLFMTVVFDYMNLITYSSQIPIDNAASFVIGLIAVAFGIKEAIQ